MRSVTFVSSLSLRYVEHVASSLQARQYRARGYGAGERSPGASVSPASGPRNRCNDSVHWITWHVASHTRRCTHISNGNLRVSLAVHSPSSRLRRRVCQKQSYMALCGAPSSCQKTTPSDPSTASRTNRSRDMQTDLNYCYCLPLGQIHQLALRMNLA